MPVLSQCESELVDIFSEHGRFQFVAPIFC